jgi:hypothetical protein
MPGEAHALRPQVRQGVGGALADGLAPLLGDAREDEEGHAAEAVPGSIRSATEIGARRPSAK